MSFGQRFANYSVEYTVDGKTWETLVPPGASDTGPPPDEQAPSKYRVGARDRPDGHDPRDSHIGHKRIDLPAAGVATAGPGALRIAKVRLNCLNAFEEPVHLASFSLHKKTVPWE